MSEIDTLLSPLHHVQAIFAAFDSKDIGALLPVWRLGRSLAPARRGRHRGGATDGPRPWARRSDRWLGAGRQANALVRMPTQVGVEVSSARVLVRRQSRC
jgi:hypothetical protein